MVHDTKQFQSAYFYLLAATVVEVINLVFLHFFFLECGELEWSAVVHHALPRICSVGNSTAGLALEEGLFGAGDALMAPSLDGAMRSGRMAAEALIEWIHRA